MNEENERLRVENEHKAEEIRGLSEDLRSTSQNLQDAIASMKQYMADYPQRLTEDNERGEGAPRSRELSASQEPHSIDEMAKNIDEITDIEEMRALFKETDAKLEEANQEREQMLKIIQFFNDNANEEIMEKLRCALDADNDEQNEEGEEERGEGEQAEEEGEVEEVDLPQKQVTSAEGGKSL